jgi:hypothetical protein
MSPFLRFRAALCWALFATFVAGAGAPHTHSFLSELLEHSEGSSEERFSTTHNDAESAARHWDSITRDVSDPCPACRADRNRSVGPPAVVPGAALGIRIELPWSRTAAVRLLSHRPDSGRAPPALPSSAV